MERILAKFSDLTRIERFVSDLNFLLEFSDTDTFLNSIKKYFFT